MYLEFVTDYERTNPMTRIEGEMRYLDKLEENYKINKTTTIIKLYEENKNFCPKCRVIKTDKQVHCIICDR